MVGIYLLLWGLEGDSHHEVSGVRIQLGPALGRVPVNHADWGLNCNIVH